MDLAKTLIRMSARAFYDKTNVRLILIIDALCIHSTLPNEDLSLLLGIQQKDLRKLCGRLREDRMISVHSRQEMREGQQRPIHRDWYFINFHMTIDAIKYRLFHLTRKVKDQFKPTEEKKDYFCPRCKAEWTQMEVLSNVSDLGEFLCQKCSGVLERHETTHEDRAGHERLSKLMSEVEPLLQQLRQIDQYDIPENGFEEAEALRIPIQRDEVINPSRRMEPVKVDQKTTLKGMKTESGPAIEVQLVDADAAEKERVEAMRKQEQQNQLPEWHIRSTVTNSLTALGLKEEARRQAVGGGSGYGTPLKTDDDEDKKKPDGEEGADKTQAMMDAYFAEVAAERERERLRPGSSSEDEDGEEDGDDDDDDDEFEDVVPGDGPSGSRAAPAAGGISLANTPAVGTPASSVSGLPNGNSSGKGARGASVPRKRENSLGSDSATPGTSAVGTPAPEQHADGGRSPAKRVKLDLDAGSAARAAADADEDDSDDDEEFEDAM